MNMFKEVPEKTPEEYIGNLPEPRKSEIQKLHNFIVKTLPHHKPFMISGNIGYGRMHYKTKTREGEWFSVGLASRKDYISLYLCGVKDGVYIAEKYKKQLPKTNIGRSCIRFKTIDDLDLKLIAKMLIETTEAGFGL